MATVHDPGTGKSLQRPAISPDGKLLAVISPDLRILLISLSDTVNGQTFITRLKVPMSLRNFLQQCHIIRWSPEFMLDDDNESTTTSEVEFGTTWLLLSNGSRIISLSTDLRIPSLGPSVDEDGARSNILADYELGGQFGSLTLVEFVFDHRHALLMFEHGSNASLLNLSRPQRDEISHIKYSDSKSFAQTPDSKRFALLRREKGQDKVSTFELSSDNTTLTQSFETQTLDAQGLMWCPSGLPMIAVWDSASYGVKVCFFTAHGHALRQLDITSANLNTITLPMDIEGVGLACWRWTRASHERTIQAVADGQKQVIVRYQYNASMIVQELTSFVHPDIIHGSKTFVWQEQKPLASNPTLSCVFLRQAATFSAASEADIPESNQVDAIELNSDHSMIATVLKGSTKMLWLWKPKQLEPHTVLLFRYPVKNILWHPTLPNVLVVLTNQKRSVLYAWYQPTLAPISGTIVMNHETQSNTLVSTVSTRYSGSWLPSATHADGRVPFLFTSATRFEVSFLQSLDGQVVFESVLRRNKDAFADDDFGDVKNKFTVDTPSRPGRKKTRFDVDIAPDTEGDELIHMQAKYGRW